MVAKRETQRIRDVYFVQGEVSGLVKIGVANDAVRRLSSLQTFSPERLTLLGVMICPRYGRLEGWVHNRFSDHRAHGEWFRPEPELLAFIAENAMDDQTAALTRMEESSRRGAPGKGLPWVMPVPRNI